MRKKRKKGRDKYLFKNIFKSFVIWILWLIIIGWIVFVIIEWRTFLDAIYFVIMTMTTIGYGDIVPTTEIGKIFAILFAFSGVPIFVGIVGLIFEWRIKNSISKHMDELEKELIETENKLEKTEKKLLDEERQVVKMGKDPI